MTNILTSLPARQASKYDTREAFRFKPTPTSDWKTESWSDFATLTDNVAASLELLGLKEQEMVAIFSANRPESLAVDFETGRVDHYVFLADIFGDTLFELFVEVKGTVEER